MYLMKEKIFISNNQHLQAKNWIKRDIGYYNGFELDQGILNSHPNEWYNRVNSIIFGKCG